MIDIFITNKITYIEFTHNLRKEILYTITIQAIRESRSLPPRIQKFGISLPKSFKNYPIATLSFPFYNVLKTERVINPTKSRVQEVIGRIMKVLVEPDKAERL